MLTALLLLFGPVPCDAQANQPKAEKYDPVQAVYSASEYGSFRAMIASGGTGVIYVGVPAPSHLYEPLLRAPSGFKGLADGVYDCRRDAATKQPTMERRVPKPAPAPVQFFNLGLPGGPVQYPPPARMPRFVGGT